MFEKKLSWKAITKTLIPQSINKVKILDSSPSFGNMKTKTDCSIFDAVVSNCQGITVNNYLYIFGSCIATENEVLKQYFPEITTAVAVDIWGGIFCIAFNDQPNTSIHYFNPQTLKWHDLGQKYSDFFEWTLKGDINSFYKQWIWSGFETDIANIDITKQLVLMYPELWSGNFDYSRFQFEIESAQKEFVSKENLWSEASEWRFEKTNSEARYRHGVTNDNFDIFAHVPSRGASFNEPWIRNENMDVSGGKTTFEDIDRLAQYPDIEIVTISGLNQETFEYFIKKYGRQFKAIRFFKNKMVSDWSLLGSLPKLEYIYWFFNQHIDSFWDMSKNISLKGICIEDFSKIKSIQGIETAPNLEQFYLGNAVWDKAVIDSFSCLKNSSIKHFNFYGKDVLDPDFSFITEMPQLEQLDFACNLLTTEQVAWIVANRPDLRGYCLGATAIPNGAPDDFKTLYVTGKGKKMLKLKENDPRPERIQKEFENLVDKYKGIAYPL